MFAYTIANFMVFHSRFEFWRAYLSRTYGERNSFFIAGCILYAAFPALHMIQNMFLLFLFNIKAEALSAGVGFGIRIKMGKGRKESRTELAKGCDFYGILGFFPRTEEIFRKVLRVDKSSKSI